MRLPFACCKQLGSIDGGKILIDPRSTHASYTKTYPASQMHTPFAKICPEPHIGVWSTHIPFTKVYPESHIGGWSTHIPFTKAYPELHMHTPIYEICPEPHLGGWSTHIPFSKAYPELHMHLPCWGCHLLKKIQWDILVVCMCHYLSKHIQSNMLYTYYDYHDSFVCN